MLRGRPELALQRLLGSHASRSTRTSASALTRAHAPRCRPELALQRLLGSHASRSTRVGALQLLDHAQRCRPGLALKRHPEPTQNYRRGAGASLFQLEAARAAPKVSFNPAISKPISKRLTS